MLKNLALFHAFLDNKRKFSAYYGHFKGFLFYKRNFSGYCPLPCIQTSNETPPRTFDAKFEQCNRMFYNVLSEI